ncbi:MAG: methylmalonyl Co-A mutase-associated GTPase MeaB [Alphaproteobacteria bacterium]|jgi:LAO/AO transport system kinase|nr:methylmalonyl Co-A mutase-associated GTPase MeaB [Alphaproteobacteria bacterium]MBT4083607.1 methylmalonyl Co-A mutase-associated GTPase MeaB [Alphaproteobacteria bacterium]MBT4545129.1 methylmalonyl Co-A mutase-associated GTPase MeaB [Alphaproteobacteria bacterium]MBT7747948.1 methylmalonyl Co-A mutase-associated GTPase MeaB [Alphaproteobacteria bacterium]
MTTAGLSEAGQRLVEKILEGQPAALSRAMTEVENETGHAAALLAAVQKATGRAVTIGITGPPGAGKSTLVNALIGEYRQAGKTVGVIAVDPSSPLSGGAILGDRIRMAEHSHDPGVFVRSFASRGHLGGLSRTAGRVIDLMDAAGWDIILIETVGAGQSEVEVADIAAIKLVVSAPGLGDDIQAIKAGILEIADILVVNKCDQPLAEQTKRSLKAMLKLKQSGSQDIPVLGTVATTSEGLAELVSEIALQDEKQRRGDNLVDRKPRIRRNLAEAVGQLAKDRLRQNQSADIDALIVALESGETDYLAAAEAVLDGGQTNREIAATRLEKKTGS